MCAKRLSLKAALFGALLILPLVAQAAPGEIIYDNSNTYLNQYTGLKTEFGDQVDFGGEARTLTSFSIEMYAAYTIADFDEVARVRIYANDGEFYGIFLDSRKPGTVLYDSGRFFVNPGFETKTFDGLRIDLPDSVTFTIQFGGFDRPDEVAGLLMYSPPTVGHSFDDFWTKTADGWILEDTPGIKDNFAARFTAINSTKSSPAILETAQQGDGVQIIATSSVGKIYYLEVRDLVLGPQNWTPRGWAVEADTSVVILKDPNAVLAPTRTYRVTTAFKHKVKDVKLDKDKKKAVISAEAEAGNTYALDVKGELGDEWFRLVGMKKAEGTDISFEVPYDPNLPHRFYRIARFW